MLEVSQNELSFVPNQISNISRLEELDLSHNEISEISNIPKKLRVLKVCSNRVSRVYLPKLKNLHTLELSDNRLISLEGLSELKSLRYLYLDSNFVETLKSLFGLELLELDISYNNIKRSETLREVASQVCVLKVSGNPFYK